MNWQEYEHPRDRRGRWRRKPRAAVARPTHTADVATADHLARWQVQLTQRLRDMLPPDAPVHVRTTTLPSGNVSMVVGGFTSNQPCCPESLHPPNTAPQMGVAGQTTSWKCGYCHSELPHHVWFSQLAAPQTQLPDPATVADMVAGRFKAQLDTDYWQAVELSERIGRTLRRQQLHPRKLAGAHDTAKLTYAYDVANADLERVPDYAPSYRVIDQRNHLGFWTAPDMDGQPRRWVGVANFDAVADHDRQTAVGEHTR